MRAKSQSFAAGAAVLMAAALVVKMVGALFKIPLTHILGGGGMGYFMTAYGFFNPIYALSVAGFPVAVSRLTAQSIATGRRGDARRILYTALLVFSVIGLALWAAIYWGAGFFTRAVGNPAAHRAVLAIAPAIFFCCVTSVFRGHFEGGRNMVPTALSQLVEAVVKLTAGICFAMATVSSGYRQYDAGKMVFGTAVETLEQAQAVISAQAAAAAIGGVTVSTAAGCVFMLLRWGMTQKAAAAPLERASTPMAVWAVRLLKTALPVCLGALVINLTSLIDLASVMNGLSQAANADLAALTASHAGAGLADMAPDAIPNFLFGSYTGLAVTVFNFVPALTATLGVCALPLISGLAARGRQAQLRTATESVLRVTAMAAVPMGLGLSVMAEPILALLFADNPAEVAVAARLLRPLGAAAVFVSVVGPVNSMLQAVGRTYVPVRLMLAGGALKLAVNLVLVRIPEVNIAGAPWGTIACYLFLMLGGCAALMKETGGNLSLVSVFWRPAAAGAFCAAAAWGSFWFLAPFWPSRLRLLPAIMLGAVCYAAALYLLRAFRKEDLLLLPSGSKFANLLENKGRLR